jgi:flagella basal body P-ring formation protein FlgA
MGRRILTGLFSAMMLAAVAGPALGQGVITLRPAARVEAMGAVVLGDIAELSGPDAQHHKDLIIVENIAAEPVDWKGGGGITIPLSRVRKALEAQNRVNFGRLTLSGAACIVRMEVEASPAVAADVTAGPPAQHGEVVRDRVTAALAAHLGVALSDLQLTFDNEAELLGMSTGGRTVAVVPGGRGDKVPVTVRVYNGDMMEASGVVRVGVLVRRACTVAAGPLARGEAPQPGQVEARVQWMPPSTTPAAMEKVLVSIVKGRVDAGKIIQDKDLEAPTIVNRGDLVTVDCLSGSVVVGTTARAKQAGSDGQVIQLQSLSSKKIFRARINGPGRAVLTSETAPTESGDPS